jgi:Tfp pilus assembly protein PilN
VKAITLNLASRPFRNNLVVGSLLWGVAAAAVLASVYNGYVYLNYGGHYGELQQEERVHLSKLATLQAEERKYAKEVQSRDFRRLYGRGQFAGDQILKRSFSWTLLFNKLEDVIPAEVMMTAIHPHIASEGIVIRVDGVAKNHGALIDLEDSLLKSPVFARVYPASERRLNPSRPEISFALNFDYLPAKAADGVAASAVAQATPGAPPAPKPESRPGPAATPAPVPAAGGVAAGAPVADSKVIGTVGRDGLPRTPELMARRVVAPGGIYPDTPPPAEKERDEAPKKPPAGRRDPKAPAAEHAPAAAPRSGTAPRDVGAGSSGGAAGNGIPGVLSPATWQDGYQAIRPPFIPGVQARRDPNLGPVLSRTQRARSNPGPVPATRLDMQLKFTARPLEVVCEALAAAHGAQFEIDPAIDPHTTVTADLSGKNLKDALATVARATGLKVRRNGDGLYLVVPVAGGEPMSEKPIREEPLVPPQDTP